MRAAARRTLNRMGVEVSRQPYLPRLVDRLHRHDITTVLDIGANEGQYATKLLEARYRGTVISVEPLRAPFEQLRAKAAKRANWHVVRAAMGAEPGTLTVHIAGNSQSSSVLPMLELHESAAPKSR